MMQNTLSRSIFRVNTKFPWSVPVIFSKESTMIDIKKMSPAELRVLRTQVDAEIRRRGSATQRLLKRVQKMATQRGFSLQELMNVAGTDDEVQTVSHAGAPIKYRNPVNPAQSWTGHGRRPTWVIDYLASGGTLDKLAGLNLRASH
jgi:DNA-binding protein H-NS